MAVKIRLQRRGRKKKPIYHIIIADSRSPRDGKFIEKIGSYDPLAVPAAIDIDRDKAFDWLMKGAEPTDTVRAILRFKGVMYRKHLSRGVSKGAMTQEEADAKYQAWIEEKESKIAARKKATQDKITDFHSKRSGSAKQVKAEEVIEEAPAVEETVAETETATTAEETPANTEAEAPAAEETPAEETPAAEAETPAEEEAPKAEAEAETPAAEETAEDAEASTEKDQ